MTSPRLRSAGRLVALMLFVLTVLAGCSVEGSAQRGTADPAPTFDRSSQAVVFAVGSVAPYNPENQQHGTEVLIHGDGTVSGDGVSAGKKLTEEQLQQLAAKAAELGLLDDPDLGGPVYDAGGIVVRLALNGRKVTLSVAPSGLGSYTKAQVAARDSVRQFWTLVQQAVK